VRSECEAVKPRLLSHEPLARCDNQAWREV
jgi:hypothetical protein